MSDHPRIFYDVGHYTKQANLDRSVAIDNQIVPTTVALHSPLCRESYVYYSVDVDHSWRYFEVIFVLLFSSLNLLVLANTANRDP